MSERVWKEKPIEEFKKFQKEFPELSGKYTELIEKTLDKSKIDRKVQELVIIGFLLGDFEEGFKFHVKEALEHGAKKEEIVGVVLLALTYCEVRKFLKGLSWIEDEGLI